MGIRNSRPARLAADLPNRVHRVLPDPCVRSDDRKSAYDGLADDHAVERVAVLLRLRVRAVLRNFTEYARALVAAALVFTSLGSAAQGGGGRQEWAAAEWREEELLFTYQGFTQFSCVPPRPGVCIAAPQALRRRAWNSTMSWYSVPVGAA